MQEIVRKIPDAAPRAAPRPPRVKKPGSALGLAAGIVVLLSGLALLVLGGLGTALMAADGELGSSSEEVEGVVYFVLFSIGQIAAGAMILAGKHKAGGVSAILVGLFVSLGVWYIGMWSVLGGIAALFVRERLDRYVSSFLALHPSVPIAELATFVKRTEADIELAVLALRDRGEKVSFDEDSRLVTLA